MTSCCSASTSSKQERQDCPACGTSCLPVSYQTMIHHVQYPENQHIMGEYAFCANPICDVVYFSSLNTIAKDKVRVLGHHQDAMLCYCFDITQSNYQWSLEHGTSESIKQFVMQQTTSKLCACNIKNPSGRCCLAHFKRMENNNDKPYHHS